MPWPATTAVMLQVHRGRDSFPLSFGAPHPALGLDSHTHVSYTVLQGFVAEREPEREAPAAVRQR
jgi:hypothetical protein